MSSPSRPPAEPTPAHLIETVRFVVRDGMPQTIAELASLVRIPSVSWDGFDPDQVQRSATATAALFRELGIFDEVIIDRADAAQGVPGQPAVIARRPARDGRPTVLLYAHHDVQPPGDETQWDSPPYEPTVRGDRLYGRGAADDKAGVAAHLAAIRALLHVDADPALGIAVFIEGEEEFGSRSFGTLLDRHRDLLQADVIVVADSDNWSVDTPSLTVSLRGNVTFTLTVSTLAHASHSGMVGGAAPDALLAAVALLATLHDAQGSVAVEGLTSFDAPVPDLDERRFRAETGVLAGVNLIGRGPLLQRIWGQPAITVTGIDAPSVRNASNTLTPSVRVKLSIRVAPGQSAADAFDAVKAHLMKHRSFGAQLAIDQVDLGDPFRVDDTGWAFEEAIVALSEGWGQPAVRAGVGGSIPFIAQLAEVFPAAQVLVTGVEDPETRAHSPNESIHLGVLHRAVVSEALLLVRLNQHPRGAASVQARDVH